MNNRLQAQEFDKLLIGVKAGCGSEQYKDRWNNTSGISVFSSNTLLPNHQNVTATGCLPYQQPPDNVWTDSFPSVWKTDVFDVLPSWSNSNDKWMTSSEKFFCEPTSSVHRQHLLKRVKVRMVAFIIEIVFEGHLVSFQTVVYFIL